MVVSNRKWTVGKNKLQIDWSFNCIYPDTTMKLNSTLSAINMKVV